MTNTHGQIQTVLVTGAAGTVGNYVLPLAEAAGFRVIATDLSTKGVQQPVRGEVRAGDLRQQEFVREIVRGCDAIVHTAGLMEVGASPEALRETNTDVVEALLGAGRASGVKRMVHLSTTLLYESRGANLLDENASLRPRGELGQSKLEAEEVIRSQPAGGPTVTVLRSAPVYGRRGRHLAATLLAVGPVIRLATPMLPRPSGGPVASLVHAEDVARAAVFALTRKETEGEIYNVGDEDPLPLGERVAETMKAYGLPTVPAGSLPRPVLDRIARVFGRSGAYQAFDSSLLTAWRFVVMRHGLKPALRVRLGREALTLLYDDLAIDSSKLRGLGWRPRYPRFGEGWRQVLRWYQAENWVPRYA